MSFTQDMAPLLELVSTGEGGGRISPNVNRLFPSTTQRSSSLLSIVVAALEPTTFPSHPLNFL